MGSGPFFLPIVSLTEAEWNLNMLYLSDAAFHWAKRKQDGREQICKPLLCRCHERNNGCVWSLLCNPVVTPVSKIAVICRGYSRKSRFSKFGFKIYCCWPRPITIKGQVIIRYQVANQCTPPLVRGCNDPIHSFTRWNLVSKGAENNCRECDERIRG